MLKMCQSCWDLQEKIGGYLQNTEKVANAKNCSVHPSLSNPRTVRTLKTIKLWSLETPGYIHPNCKGLQLVPKEGHVHRWTAESILFDYEKPIIDFLIFENLLNLHDGVPKTLTVSKRGDDFIRNLIDKD